MTQPGPHHTQNLQHVLIIEDEPGIADNIVFATEAEGFHATVAQTGQKGIELWRKGEFSFVILDIGLPDISGLEVCKLLRRESSIPLLFLTARSDEIDRILGLELGADDYLTKPFSPRELVARMRAILRRANPIEPESSLEDELLIIDTNRREVFFHQVRVPLSYHEFEMLSLLHSRPGWVFSRSSILDAIWEDPLMVTERTIDAHIKSLRKKLRTAHEQEIIQTHRSVGYSLKLPC